MTTSKIAVVTGATGGMGREIILDLARDHHVYALGRRADELAGMDNVTPVAIDLVEALDKDEEENIGLPELDRVDVLAQLRQQAAGDLRRRVDVEVHLLAPVFRPRRFHGVLVRPCRRMQSSDLESSSMSA